LAWRPVWRSALTTIFVPEKGHQALKLSALEPCGAIFPVTGCGAASRVSAALDEVDSLLRLTPQDPELSRLGTRLSLQCTTPPMLGRAAAFLEGADAEPNHRDYLRFQALLTLGQGQPEEALRLLEESPPDHGEAQILRLQILRHLNRPREALPLAQDLVIRTETSGLPRLRELLAWACRETGDNECFVRETLRSALSGNPAARALLEQELQKGSLPEALQDLAAAAVELE
jgi:hypothetical protein